MPVPKVVRGETCRLKTDARNDRVFIADTSHTHVKVILMDGPDMGHSLWSRRSDLHREKE